MYFSCEGHNLLTYFSARNIFFLHSQKLLFLLRCLILCYEWVLISKIFNEANSLCSQLCTRGILCSYDHLKCFYSGICKSPFAFSPHTSIRGLEVTLAQAVIFSSSVSIDALSFYGEWLLLVSAIRPRCFIHL